MLPLFDEASRVTCNSTSCIDNIMTNASSQIIERKVLNLHVADHFAQIIYIQGATIKNNFGDVVVNQRYINTANYTLITKMLQDVNWKLILLGDGHVVFTQFLDYFLPLLNDLFPVKEKKITQHRNRCGVVDNHLITKMKEELDAIYTIVKVTKSAEMEATYKYMKKRYREAIATERRKTITREIENSNNKVKTIWKIIKLETNLDKKIHKNINIDPDDFNNYFCNVAKKLTAAIPGPNLNPIGLLENRIRSTNHSIFLSPTNKYEIKTIIGKLRKTRALDVYGLSAETIMLLKDHIAEPIACCLNSCMQSGYFPDELKVTKIVPIFKKGDKLDAGNYRPIAIVPVLSKVYEMVLKVRLLTFFEKNKIFSHCQHGFRKQKSTVTAIVDIIEAITAAFDEKQECILTCCDLSKAFDCVDHNILLQKLYHYGIRGRAYNMIKSYLNNRSQLVYCNNKWSKVGLIDRGVPQGSVLGPLLFLIYINDLPNNVTCEKICLFADDTTLLTRGSVLGGLRSEADAVQMEVEEWLRSNALSLNKDKTQKMLVTTKNNYNSETVCLLGLYLTSSLKYKDHVDHLNKKLCTATYAIRRIMEVGSYEAAKAAYFAMFQSRATYCILLWGHSAETNRVFLKQKEVIRILSNVSSKTSCRTLFKKHNLLTIPSLYILSCAEYVHTNFSKYSTHNSIHLYNTRGSDDIVIPYHRVNKAQTSTNYFAVKVYNQLPNYLKTLQAKKFKQAVKQILINNEYYSVADFLNSAF